MSFRDKSPLYRFWPAAWLLAGLTCVLLDETLQPALRAAGKNETVDFVAHLWNELGATWGIAFFLIAGAVASWRDRGVTVKRFASGLALAGLAVQIVKHLVGRARPSSLDGMTQFYGPLAWLRVGGEIRIDSMPSGHTAAAFSMATILSLRWPRFTPLWFLIAIGVALCRTLTNSHFPSDVIVGACLGTLVSLWAYNRILPSRWSATRFQLSAGQDL